MPSLTDAYLLWQHQSLAALVSPLQKKPGGQDGGCGAEIMAVFEFLKFVEKIFYWPQKSRYCKLTRLAKELTLDFKRFSSALEKKALVPLSKTNQFKIIGKTL
jgi:hypothetical protein